MDASLFIGLFGFYTDVHRSHALKVILFSEKQKDINICKYIFKKAKEQIF